MKSANWPNGLPLPPRKSPDVGGEEFGFEILRVQEIIRIQPLTRVPLLDLDRLMSNAERAVVQAAAK